MKSYSRMIHPSQPSSL